MVPIIILIIASLFGWKLREDLGKVTLTHAIFLGVVALFIALVFGWIMTATVPAYAITITAEDILPLAILTILGLMIGYATRSAYKWISGMKV